MLFILSVYNLLLPSLGVRFMGPALSPCLPFEPESLDEIWTFLEASFLVYLFNFMPNQLSSCSGLCFDVTTFCFHYLN